MAFLLLEKCTPRQLIAGVLWVSVVNVAERD
jgi:hypothetical protein